LHWDGSVWSPDSDSAIPSGRLNGVWGSGAEDVWAVGDAGTILHWNGHAWAALSGGTTEALSAVWGSGPDDVWAVGAGVFCSACSSDSDCSSGFACSNGVCQLPTLPDGGACSDGNVTHWNGLVWSVASNTTSQTLTDVWGSGPGDVWATGAGAWAIPGYILRSDGSSWSVSTTTNTDWHGVWGSGPDDVWTVGGGVMHWNGSGWSTVLDPPDYLEGVWGTGRCDLWTVGLNGTILHHH
jgi:hypothetical protein